jgi:hypothetical protein
VGGLAGHGILSDRAIESLSDLIHFDGLNRFDFILAAKSWASGFGCRASAKRPKRSGVAVVSDLGEG